MLYREIIAVSSQIQTKHINTLSGQNVEFVNAKRGGTYSNLEKLKINNSTSCIQDRNNWKLHVEKAKTFKD
jgi:hypothetical protein